MRSSTGSQVPVSANATAAAIFRCDLGVENRDGSGVEIAVLLKLCPEHRNAVAFLPAFYFGLVPVQLEIEHRMGPEAVGAELDKRRPVATADRVGHASRGIKFALIARDHVFTGL